MEPAMKKWAIFLRGKVIPSGDKTVEEIQRNPTDIMGWYKEKAMKA